MIGSGYGLSSFGVNLMPESMLTFCQLDTQANFTPNTTILV